ncbi:M23 family metallopeptidase [Helicobacter sp. 23-1048]
MLTKRGIFIAFLSLIIAFFVLYIISNAIFERNGPSLDNTPPEFWNLKDEIVLEFSDESGIKSYEIELFLDNDLLVHNKEVVLNKSKKLKLPLPKPSIELKNGVVVEYRVKVNDWSNANLFIGNSSSVNIFLVVDKDAPQVRIFGTSPQIRRGGSALVVFSVKDIALDSVVLSNGKDEFSAFEYNATELKLEENEKLYATLIAWSLPNTFFDGKIIAKDKANNTTKISLPIAKSFTNPIMKSNIHLKEQFLNTKIPSLLELIGKKATDFNDDKERFLFINEIMRKDDERQILEATKNSTITKNYLDSVFAFRPLRGALTVGTFGDERSYYINKELLNISYHLGVDLASVKNAPIFISNDGLVVFKKYLTIHGQTAIIYHGMGMFSLYAHMEESPLKVGDRVYINDEVGRTGSSGWAFGDHLHLEILIQGIPVMCSKEWLAPSWVESNINAVLLQALQDFKDSKEGREDSSLMTPQSQF